MGKQSNGVDLLDARKLQHIVAHQAIKVLPAPALGLFVVWGQAGLRKAAALYDAYEPLGWEIVPWLLVALDLVLSIVIVNRVPCESWTRLGERPKCCLIFLTLTYPFDMHADTEIDWVAYMQEVIDECICRMP